MKILDCPQYSDEWWDARIGRASCSNLSRILTPARLEYSKGARAYASELIAERMIGKSLEEPESGGTPWTQYGSDTEAQARAWYAFYRDAEVREVGSIINDAGNFMGSPDGLVGEDGLVEFKCFGLKHHARVITGADPDIANRLQTQGYLWLTGREWIDVVAYNPVLPKKIIRQYPDEEVQEMIGKQLARFFREMETAERKLEELGDVIEEDESLKWDLVESLAEAEVAA